MTTGLKSIAERVIDWNSKRYDQVYDYNLASSLLIEETAELFAAIDPVEKLDAIGDIVFVAIGVLWKMGFTAEEIDGLMHNIELEKVSLDMAHTWSCNAMFEALDHPEVQSKDGAYQGLDLALNCIFLIAFGALQGMGLQHEFYNVVHAICDSNDTKEVKGKTDPSVKANIVKGEGFVPPTAALRKIIYINSKHTGE